MKEVAVPLDPVMRRRVVAVSRRLGLAPSQVIELAVLNVLDQARLPEGLLATTLLQGNRLRGSDLDKKSGKETS